MSVPVTAEAVAPVPAEPSAAAQPVCEVVRAARPWMSVREPSDNEDEDDEKKSRGKYRCGRCGAPKAGHVCPLESRSVRRRVDRSAADVRDHTRRGSSRARGRADESCRRRLTP